MSTNLLRDPAWTGEASVPSGPSADGLEDSRGRWPRMLVLDDDVEERLHLWLDDEITRFQSERGPLLEQWEKWQTQYWAEPEKAVRNFPFRKAANIVVPLTAIAVEAVHARLMNTLFSVEPFWSIRPRSPAWVEAAKPFERYLQMEVENAKTLNAYDFCNEALLELIKLGTSVSKSGYKREIRKSKRFYDEDTEEDRFVETYNGATLEHVPLANFMMRLAETDPQQAGWVGERHRVTWGQLKRMASSGRMDSEAVESIRENWVDTAAVESAHDGHELTKKVQDLADAEPTWFEEFQFYEIWCSFDVDGDGWDEEIVLDYHKETGTFLSARYNWNEDLHRPYRIGRYIVVEGIWPGIGIGKQNEQFQEEVTTIHRQRLDNATLANMAQVVIRKNSGYGPGEPIFPGKMWFMDDVNDIKEFKLSEVYPSAYANEEGVIRHSEKRTGVNEAILGIPQQGTPGTATSDMAKLAEANKRFDLVLKNVRKWLGVVGVDVITNYQQFGNQNVHWMMEEEDGAWVERVLRMPAELVARGAIVEITVTDSITNRDVEKRERLELFQVVTSYYERAIQMSQMMSEMMQDPAPMVQTMQKAAMAADEALKLLLDTYSIPGVGKYALFTEEQGGPESRTTGQAPGASSGPGGGPGRAGLTSGVAGVPPNAGPGGGGVSP